MKHRFQILSAVAAAALMLSGCNRESPVSPDSRQDRSALVGAWRSHVNFRSGPLAGFRDLEFLYAFNAGGTMTESSNYDEAANSSPPAYGEWRQVAPRRFEARYVFFTTKARGPSDGAPTATDWWPDGRGELTETIALSQDGRTSTSKLSLALFDKAGAQIGTASDGTGTGERIQTAH